MLTEDEIQESIRDHAARNAELLEQLAGKGVGADKTRPLQFHFWAAAGRDAALLARDLHRKGYLVLAIAPRDTGDGSQFWNVEAELELPPGAAASAAVTGELVRLAGEHDSLYDGWGCEL